MIDQHMRRYPFDLCVFALHSRIRDVDQDIQSLHHHQFVCDSFYGLEVRRIEFERLQQISAYSKIGLRYHEVNTIARRDVCASADLDLSTFVGEDTCDVPADLVSRICRSYNRDFSFQ